MHVTAREGAGTEFRPPRSRSGLRKLNIRAPPQQGDPPTECYTPPTECYTILVQIFGYGGSPHCRQ